MKNPTEHAEQVAVVDWCRSHGLLVMSIPNGARVSPGERAKLKREGLEVGAPDLVIRTPPPLIDDQWPILLVAVEMKCRGGGRLSPAQVAWAESVAGMPWWRVLVCEGARDAVEQLKALGYGRGEEK